QPRRRPPPRGLDALATVSYRTFRLPHPILARGMPRHLSPIDTPGRGKLRFRSRSAGIDPFSTANCIYFRRAILMKQPISSKQRLATFRRERMTRDAQGDGAAPKSDGKEKPRPDKQKRRQLLKQYVCWLWPFRWALLA